MADKPAQSLPTDPDDDFDELDDVLPQFTPELTKGMEDLMRELSVKDGSTENDGSSDDPSAESARALKAVWEEMLIEGMNGVGQNETTGGGFQDTIKQAVNKLKESESDLQADGKSPNPPANVESFEALLSSLGDLDEGDDKELAGLLENMMGELMSKSILYEPLSELARTFPSYLEKPPNPLSDEDRKRYSLQLDCVRRIVAVFDQAGHDDKNTESQQRIADLMAEMQNYGSPPSELMGPLPDLNEEGCTIT